MASISDNSAITDRVEVYLMHSSKAARYLQRQIITVHAVHVCSIHRQVCDR